MPNVTLLISPPGGGKTTWIKNNGQDSDCYDDLSLISHGLEKIAQSMKKQKDIVIADINLCNPQTLTKAKIILQTIANQNNYDINFIQLVFVGHKEEFLRNIKARNDGRNVLPSLNIYYPYLEELQHMEGMIKIKVHKKGLENGK